MIPAFAYGAARNGAPDFRACRLTLWRPSLTAPAARSSGKGREAVPATPLIIQRLETRALKNVDVLMLSPMMPLIMEGIAREFNLHKAWEAPDRDAFIKELAPSIRGLAPGSHYRVDAHGQAPEA
jgi:hypothetical protein